MIQLKINKDNKWDGIVRNTNIFSFAWRIKKMSYTFLEIKWRKEDIQNLLKDNGMDSSEQAVNNFLEKFDIQYFEEMCIQTGWEMLQSAI